MKTSDRGINLIRGFEGCCLRAYKALPTEQYYTIGYGHYGSDVKVGMVISAHKAIQLLVSDLEKCEKSVNRTKLRLTQNQFDALVSFTYNCGAGNLSKLVKNRSLAEIADAFLLYNKAGGRTIAGLTKRRKAERALFLEGYSSACNDITVIAKEVIDGKWGNGTARVNKLTEAGYNYRQVQNEVNRLLGK